MTELHRRTLVGVARPVAPTTDAGLDSLHQVPVPLVPEIRLHLGADAIVLWARMKAEARMTPAGPCSAFAWLGGQAPARFVLRHRETFLERAAARGTEVLVGDPGRADTPGRRLRVVATCPAFSDAGITPSPRASASNQMTSTPDQMAPAVFRQTSGPACHGWHPWREDLDPAAGMAATTYPFCPGRRDAFSRARTGPRWRGAG